MALEAAGLLGEVAGIAQRLTDKSSANGDDAGRRKKERRERRRKNKDASDNADEADKDKKGEDADESNADAEKDKEKEKSEKENGKDGEDPDADSNKKESPENSEGEKRRRDLTAARLRAHEVLSESNREVLNLQHRLKAVLADDAASVTVTVAAKHRLFSLAAEFLDAACVSFDVCCRKTVDDTSWKNGNRECSMWWVSGFEECFGFILNLGEAEPLGLPADLRMQVLRAAAAVDADALVEMCERQLFERIAQTLHWHAFRASRTLQRGSELPKEEESVMRDYCSRVVNAIRQYVNPQEECAMKT